MTWRNDDTKDAVSLAANATGAVKALPLRDPGQSLLVTNLGPDDAFIRFGASPGVVCTATTGVPVLAGAAYTFDPDAGKTHVFGICAASETATLRFAAGEGQ